MSPCISLVGPTVSGFFCSVASGGAGDGYVWQHRGDFHIPSGCRQTHLSEGESCLTMSNSA